MARHKWSEEDDLKLKELFALGKKRAEIADRLFCSESQVRDRLRGHGLARKVPNRSNKEASNRGKDYVIKYPNFPSIITDNVYAFFWNGEFPLTAED